MAIRVNCICEMPQYLSARLFVCCKRMFQRQDARPFSFTCHLKRSHFLCIFRLRPTGLGCWKLFLWPTTQQRLLKLSTLLKGLSCPLSWHFSYQKVASIDILNLKYRLLWSCATVSIPCVSLISFNYFSHLPTFEQLLRDGFPLLSYVGVPFIFYNQNDSFSSAENYLLPSASYDFGFLLFYPGKMYRV
jgi:hypothetical protein